MIITQLIKKNSRMIIVFDNGDNIRIHYDVFIRNGLRRGDVLSEDKTTLLQSQSDLLYAKESALRLLGRRMHSTRELKQKLLLKKYQKNVIDQVIDDLSQSGFVDDSIFAKQFVEEKINRKEGLLKIKNELLGKGISKEILTDVLSQIDSNLEYENALKTAEKKASQLIGRGIEGIKLKQKLYAFLISRGYKYDLVSNILDEINL